MADPRAWALEFLGFPMGTGKVSKSEVMRHYRGRLRTIHPDLGGSDAAAAAEIEKLSEARRILLA
jgi:hypothetical protein